MLNRAIPPVSKTFKAHALPPFCKKLLPNGIPVYMLQYGTIEVLEVQLVFRAGGNYQPQPGLAGITAECMLEGTTSYSGAELAKMLDGYGAWIEHQVEEEALSISLVTLSANLTHTLPLLQEVATQATFTEDEFTKLIGRTLQKKVIQSKESRYQAQRHFGHLLFGHAHPYGSSLGVEEVQQISLGNVCDYFRSHIQPANMALIVSGKYDEENVWTEISKVFGRLDLTGTPIHIEHWEHLPAEKGRKAFEHEGMQSSLRLGHRTMARSHPDFYKMLFVNTLLGGYFGSRLMRNIREEKGFTYGIYSAWVAQKHDGYFVVQTDVGNEYVETTISEIKKEIQHLIEKGADEDEMLLVRNYLLGQSISLRETPFQVGDILRFSLMLDISFEELDRKFEVISSIQAEDVPHLAATYLKPDELLEIVVGKA